MSEWREHAGRGPKILIDGMFFQYSRTGIARVWQTLLQAWAKEGFARQLLVLDRAGTAPRVEGIHYRVVAEHDYSHPGRDTALLQTVCDEEGADLFVSTYYTSPIRTPSVFMAYDMIPEMLRWDMDSSAMWRLKRAGVLHASSFIAISHNTAKDLVACYPSLAGQAVTVAHCGVSFRRPPADQVLAFKRQHGIERPYFMLSGTRAEYKNALLFFQALALLGEARQQYAVVCTGSSTHLEPEMQACLGPAQLHMLELDDAALQCAYAGALALAYPSRYEGFGMPVIEAMACGCPVITCANSSLPEVAGEAALYVPPDDPAAMLQALQQVQQPARRAELVAAGLAQAGKFSWDRMASTVRDALLAACAAQPAAAAQAPAPDAGAAMPSGEGLALPPGLLPVPQAHWVQDPFARVLQLLAQRPDLHRFLHLGGGTGPSWAAVLADALVSADTTGRKQLLCVDDASDRLACLQARYRGQAAVQVLAAHAVGATGYLSEAALSFFHQSTRTLTSRDPLDVVVQRLRRAKAALAQSALPTDGLVQALAQAPDAHHDVVVIDGAEFCGDAALAAVLGSSRVIVLTGVNTVHGFNAVRLLAGHMFYAPAQNLMQLRTGYAVFERRF